MGATSNIIASTARKKDPTYWPCNMFSLQWYLLKDNLQNPIIHEMNWPWPTHFHSQFVYLPYWVITYEKLLWSLCRGILVKALHLTEIGCHEYSSLASLVMINVDRLVPWSTLNTPMASNCLTPAMSSSGIILTSQIIIRFASTSQL